MDRLTTTIVTTPLGVLPLHVNVVPRVGQMVRGMVPPWRMHRRRGLELLWWGCMMHPCCCHLHHGGSLRYRVVATHVLHLLPIRRRRCKLGMVSAA
jgi:hypothetical protein